MANLKLRSMSYEDFMRIPIEERDYQTIYSLSNGDLWIMNRNVGNDVLMVADLPENPVEGTLYIRKSDHKGFYWDGEWYSISGDSGNLVPYVSLKKIKDYFYDIHYAQLDYDYAYDYFKDDHPANIGACSSIRNGNWYGRNFDWIYSESVDFLVRTPRNGDRYATMGIASNAPGLTKAFVESGEASQSYRIVPFKVVDGINEKGVVINSNVVPIDNEPTTKVVPTGTVEVSMSALMIPRYILDHFDSASTAVTYIKQHMEVFMPKSLADMKYELHFMVADKDNTYLVEFVNNRTVVVNMTASTGGALAGKPYMTNFYLNNVIFNADGGVYTPETQTDLEDAQTTNRITPHGSGLERYNLIVENYNTANTKGGMRNLLNALKYTKAYDGHAETSNPFWNTEYVYDDVTVSSAPSAFAPAKAVGAEMFANRSRDPESEYYGTWQTMHSVVYDIEDKKLYIIVQEDGEELSYSLDYYWTVGETKEALDEKQNVLIAGTGIKIDGDVISSLLDVSIGKDITTNITVGALDSGTEIPANTTLADILERILVAPPVTTVKLYYGVTSGIPTDLAGLTEVEVGKDELIGGYRVFYQTEDQRVVFACPKELGLLTKIMDATDFFNLIDGFERSDIGDYYLYYEADTTYDPEGNYYRYVWG